MRITLAGAIILFALIMLIQPVSAGWNIQTVDPTSGRGEWSSLAVDSNGNYHISYYDRTNGNLMYAYGDGTSWKITPVDSAGDVGRSTSIIVTGGRPAISYYDLTNLHLKYAEKNAEGNWWSTTVDNTAFSGLQTSMTTNSIGRPHIAYSFLADPIDTIYNLKYAYWDPDGWHVETPDSSGSVGMNPSITMLPDGRMGISYYDVSNGNLKYTESQPAGDWAIFTILDEGDVGQYSSVTVRPHAYSFCTFNAAAGDLEFTCNKPLETYSLTKVSVDPGPETGYFCSMACDKYGFPCIAYFSKHDGSIWYAWSDPFWHVEKVAQVNNPGGEVPQIWVHLAFDPSGNACISYYDNIENTLKFARKTGAYTSLPASKDYSKYFTLLDYQWGSGGCGSFATMHAFEIMKEMEWPYTPDPSYAFLAWIFARVGDPNGDDPRIPYDPTINQAGIVKWYGLCSETMYPTNHPGPNLLTPPSDEAFDEAKNYNISEYSQRTYSPSVELAKYLLIKNGPYVISDLYPAHIVALVGYDDAKKVFKVIDSSTWDSKPAGLKTFQYSRFNDRVTNGDVWITCLKNKPTPLIHPYVARINVSIPSNRTYLTVQLGVEGLSPVTVWDRNNLALGENVKSLVIDVPLPDYAANYWPPSTSTSPWYLTVVNNDPTNKATINEFTLVKRYSAISGRHSAAITNALKSSTSLSPSSTKIIYFPGIEVTTPNGGQVWPRGTVHTIRWTYSGNPGSKVKIELLKGPNVVRVISTSASIGSGGQGSHSWRIPNNQEKGTDYRIQISSASNPVYRDASDGFFTIGHFPPPPPS